MFKTFIISLKVYNILNLSAKVLKNKGITKMQWKKIKNSNSAPKLKQHFTVLMIKGMIPSRKVLLSASEIVLAVPFFFFSDSSYEWLLLDCKKA